MGHDLPRDSTGETYEPRERTNQSQRRRPLCIANSPRAGAGVKVQSENFLIPTFRHLIPSEDGEELRQESYSPWELRRRVAE